MVPAPRYATTLFATTICLSAALLFSLQPMIAKMALPLLGGTPAVWAISMCVFQGLLLAGYSYAHLISRHLSGFAALAVHLALLLAGAWFLPFALPTNGAAPQQDNYALWLIVILVTGIGVPFFALSANAPLLQSWYSRVSDTDSANPYSLYVASNAGSLLSLLAYPFLIEPLSSLPQQRRAWTFGYAILLALIALCGLLAQRHGRHEPREQTLPPPAALSYGHRLPWLILALVPSGLLVAFTTFLTTDLASAPLLWVIPLALYLASFMAVFRDPPSMTSRSLAGLQITGTVVTLAALEWNAGWSWAVSAAAGLVAFSAASFLCHRLLYERRPAATHLTAFYFWMSLGGVLGGVTAALAAPKLFVDVIEFPLLLAAALTIALVMTRQTSDAPNRYDATAWQATIVITVAVAALVVASRSAGIGAGTPLRFWAVATAAGATLALIAWPRAATLAALATIAAAVFLPPEQAPLHTTRSFFGTHRVVAVADGRIHTLQHGTTVHGAEFRRDDQGRIPSRPLPLTYYHPSGPLARAIGLARDAKGGMMAALNVGIVGLGAGAIACYAGPRDTWRFYEIDPDVVRIARSADYFRYMSVCAPNADIQLGDARQVLQSPADRLQPAFDVLLIDAFSSDAIPVHLLTREAIALYLSRIAPDGILALHVSNQTLDLIPSLEATLAGFDGLTAVYAEGTRGQGALASQVVLVTRDAARIAPALTWHEARRLGPAKARPWTDDHSDIVMPLLRKILSRRNATP
jgi:hypothetical protein